MYLELLWLWEIWIWETMIWCDLGLVCSVCTSLILNYANTMFTLVLVSITIWLVSLYSSQGLPISTSSYLWSAWWKKWEQDGPSLESSSYLNVSFRYLDPWDPWTLEHLNLGTLGPLPSSNTSSYFLLHPLTSSYLILLLSSFGMVWFFFGGGLSFDIGDWDGLVEIDLWPLS